MPKTESDSYDGYSLFKDISNEALRAHNRGAVLRNISLSVVDKKTGKIPSSKMTRVLGYYGQIPPTERNAALTKFLELIRSDGYDVSL